ncbi:hypothetical protein [Roseovarius arcticus]|uniref:hypothetical protein n=1 Tax=Roseovarius arcticus TaxID=2547404 RepID=UPI0014862B19|nr:hypothetical protein [Roseovarius arcticus]
MSRCSHWAASAASLTLKDAAAIKTVIPGVVAAAPNTARPMREHRRIGPNEEDDFNVFDMAQISSMLPGFSVRSG